MDKEIISLATDRKFTEFSDAIKNVLRDKLSSHEVVKDYATKIDDFSKMKSVFSGINSGE